MHKQHHFRLKNVILSFNALLRFSQLNQQTYTNGSAKGFLYSSDYSVKVNIEKLSVCFIKLCALVLW